MVTFLNVVAIVAGIVGAGVIVAYFFLLARPGEGGRADRRNREE